MFIVIRKLPNSSKYLITDNPQKDDKIVIRTKRITDIFWGSHRNTDPEIRSRLKLPDDMLDIVKRVTDTFFKEMIKDSEYQKHQDKLELDKKLKE